MLSTTVTVFNQMFEIHFLQVTDQLFLYNQSLNSLNVWEAVVKFLDMTVLLLILQSGKDGAAR